MLTRLAAGLLLLATPAAAAPLVELKTEPGWSLVVRPDCERFLPPKDVADPRYWDRWLSLASCMEDTTRTPTEDPSDVPEMVAELSLAAMPALLLWRDALGAAPPKVQRQAAYHVGLAAVALITRARSSLVARPGVDALERARVLRERLEPLLAPAKSMAWTAFTAVDHEATMDTEWDHDPVSTAMVASARRMLQVLERPADPAIQLAAP